MKMVKIGSKYQATFWGKHDNPVHGGVTVVCVCSLDSNVGNIVLDRTINFIYKDKKCPKCNKGLPQDIKNFLTLKILLDKL